MTMTGNKKHTLASSARSLSSFCSTSTSLFWHCTIASWKNNISISD
jgi:hypothetical protein